MISIKILIVDDEEKIRYIIKEYAIFEGFIVDEASNGMDAIGMCNKYDYDIIIMDIMMPQIDGFATVKEIRKKKNMPIIMLSARGEEYDKLYGFELGIDDYVVKPFSPKELIARIKAVVLRTEVKTNEKNGVNKIQYKDMVIDLLGRKVMIDNIKLELTPKEYELLVYLIENKNIALSREKILNQIWDYSFYGDNRTVDTHVKMLRNAIGKYRENIVTVRGMGYKFEE